MNRDFTPFLEHLPVREPLMWVVDTRDGMLLDMTPATRAFLQEIDQVAYVSTVSNEEHARQNRNVVASGDTTTVAEWTRINGSWHRMVRTKSHAGGERVLEMSHDTTHMDPRAPWLARINLADQRLELDSGESISFNEFVVLRLLLKGYQHKRISNTLNISPKTVEYRIARIKNALQVDSTEAMMLEVMASGLIFLATIPIDPADPAQTELALYQKVPH